MAQAGAAALAGVVCCGGFVDDRAMVRSLAARARLEASLLGRDFGLRARLAYRTSSSRGEPTGSIVVWVETASTTSASSASFSSR